MFKNKKSFTLIELAIYIIAVGVLVILIIGGQVIVENAKVVRLNDEIEYYEKANAHFIIRYNSLPGLLSERKCLYYEDFSDYCRNQDDINLTTSEHIYTNDNCDNQLGCILESNGTSGSEDVLRNFLLPMRYLKTAGEIDTMEFGIEKELTENEDYSKKTWALSRYERNVYVNIYNYYNKNSDTTLPFIFNNNHILGHTINSGKSYDHYEKLLNKQKQYLVYHKFTTEQKGAISTNIAFKLDKKFDDGKPLTGKITTYATSDFSSFANSEYAQCIDGDPINYVSTKNINYVKSNGSKSGYCNILYQLKDLSDSINDESDIIVTAPVARTITLVRDSNLVGSDACLESSNGTSKCGPQTLTSCENNEGICIPGNTYACNVIDDTIAECVENKLENYTYDVSTARVVVAGVEKQLNNTWSGAGHAPEGWINGFKIFSCGTAGSHSYDPNAIYKMNYGDQICVKTGTIKCQTSYNGSFQQRKNNCSL